MADATAAIQVERRGECKSMNAPIATATTIYKGQLVGASATGFAEHAGDDAGLAFLGIAAETVVNSGADGAKSVEVYYTGVFKLVGSGFEQVDLGRLAYAVDSSTVGDGTVTTNDEQVGVVVEFVSATSVWVDIGMRTIIAST